MFDDFIKHGITCMKFGDSFSDLARNFSNYNVLSINDAEGQFGVFVEGSELLFD
ncbi:hypothetical protein XA3_01160 [Xylocopilactobacillus apicola]|uniref:Uncharacterized protein n=2 Tax=Xylocopilactobacillus apicola TaxID=2932184 RepID=A0AAU9DCZ8_9LACO|nr:hypothetical protein XA3_01160 [Xylocopilactobacillus apicola]